MYRCFGHTVQRVHTGWQGRNCYGREEGRPAKDITQKDSSITFRVLKNRISGRQKNHIDPILSIANFTNGYVGESLIPEVARENGEFFAENSQVAVPLPMTSELSNNIGDINTARTYVIAQVALGYMTVDEGMDYYNKTVGSLSNAVLKSLNK